ncbi:YitT family protein [Weissella minor]|uniref:YitT family protein n=1 Tax=Weissella minor TaxID=1620 RepID=UPI001BAF1061|nr:YitT family protein [Weissella minor]MBS0949570.1 YitT family protein [Weissella minor]
MENQVNSKVSSKRKKAIVHTLLFLVALEIVAISINFFYAPINVAAGGATGIAILLNAAFGFDRSLTVLAVNILSIFLAMIFLDRSTVKKIVFGSFALPILMRITPSFQIIDDELLAVMIGGIVFATGIAFIYRLDASSGGTTVPPLILKKYFNINTAYSLLVIDMIVTFFNIFVSGTNAFFLAAFSLMITSIVMRRIEIGLDLKQQVTIMSNDHIDDIKERLMSDEQNLTIMNVRGGYTDNNRDMLMVMVDSQSYRQLLNDVHEIDEKAFVVTTNVTEVHGGML